MSAFMRMLWSGRDRRKPNVRLQERIAQYTLRTAWDVKGTPIACPIPAPGARMFVPCSCGSYHPMGEGCQREVGERA